MSDFNDAIPEIRWYVVHTFTGYENKVKANLEKIIENRELQDEIVDIRIPIELRMDGEKQYEAKLLPSYVLVKMLMNDANWHVVRNITGVTGFVGPGSKPVPLTEAEMVPLGIRQEDISVDYEVGDTVQVVAGAWADTVGIIQSLNVQKQTLTINVELFGRETPVEISFAEVKKF